MTKQVEWLGGPKDGLKVAVEAEQRHVRVCEEYTDWNEVPGVVTVYHYDVPISKGKIRWQHRALIRAQKL